MHVQVETEIDSGSFSACLLHHLPEKLGVSQSDVARALIEQGGPLFELDQDEEFIDYAARPGVPKERTLAMRLVYGTEKSWQDAEVAIRELFDRWNVKLPAGKGCPC